MVRREGGETYRVARDEVLFVPRRARARALVVWTRGARGVVVGRDVSRPTVARLREGPLAERVGVRLAPQHARHRRELVEDKRGARRRLSTRGALCDPPGAGPATPENISIAPSRRIVLKTRRLDSGWIDRPRLVVFAASSVSISGSSSSSVQLVQFIQVILGVQVSTRLDETRGLFVMYARVFWCFLVLNDSCLVLMIHEFCGLLF